MDNLVNEASSSDRVRAVQPTIGGSVYVKPQDIAWEPTQFEGISIKVLYEDKAKGEMTCLLKWEPGATLPMHKHPEIEQTFAGRQRPPLVVPLRAYRPVPASRADRSRTTMPGQPFE